MFFVWMLIFIMFHLGIPVLDPMTLFTDVMWQCHHNVGPVQTGELKGISPYHSLPNNIYSFNLLGMGFYTLICEEVRLW